MKVKERKSSVNLVVLQDNPAFTRKIITTKQLCDIDDQSAGILIQIFKETGD